MDPVLRLSDLEIVLHPVVADRDQVDHNLDGQEDERRDQESGEHALHDRHPRRHGLVLAVGSTVPRIRVLGHDLMGSVRASLIHQADRTHRLEGSEGC